MKKYLLVLLCFFIVACDKKKDEKTEASASSTVLQTEISVVQPDVKPNLTKQLDVGKIGEEQINSTGTGISPNAAVNDALKSAIQQVNGTAVDAVSVSMNITAQADASMNVESKEGPDFAKASASLRSQAYGDKIVSSSNGAVSSFRIIEIKAPTDQSGQYTASISTTIPKFVKPIDSGKIKIVISRLKFSKPTFNIGGNDVPAQPILDSIRRKINNALIESNRFTVLDRDNSTDVDNELSLITSGKTDKIDFGKLGQNSSADLIWIGTVDNLAYEKQIRKLQTSDRKLVSFSGAWSVSQQLINVATKQVAIATSLQGDFPPVAPTTLGATFDESATLNKLVADISNSAVSAIMLRAFPISILDVDGEAAVLSQGQGAVLSNARYKVYKQGNELKDPQTGQSLGNLETECCELVVNRVTPQTAYGTLENIKIKLDGIQPGVLRITEPPLTSKVIAQSARVQPLGVSHQSQDAPKTHVVHKPTHASGSVDKKDDW